MVSLGDLVNGENIGAILSGKIAKHFDRDQEVPVAFMLVDFKTNLCGLSIY